MLTEVNFHNFPKIVSCTFEGKRETSGLEGIKFRLDDTSDITWYNDLVSPLPESKDCITCCDSASVLFSCETFEVNESNPRLVFGAFVGHSIEFKTNTLEPTDILILECENWYALECKRLKEGQAAGQEKEFSFITALEEAYFSDVIIKSSCGLDYHVHSSILRLNGFDCSMCIERDESTIAVSFQQPICKTHEQCLKPVSEQTAKKKQHNQIKISLTTEVESDESHMQKSHPRLHLSPLYLHPPVDTGVLAVSNRASSFNCLMASGNSQEATEIGRMKKYLLTSSDSHLETNYGGQSKNIFNFCNDLLLNPVVEPSVVYSNRRPPLSPYRARSPSPFPISMDTPPSSPLTPVGILNNLPSFLLTPILHWLYTESLIPNMNEDMCEKLINLAETQPPLTKMVEPCRKYLKLIRLKKFAINIIMDLHNILNKMIQRINPITISHQPVELYSTFKDCLRECAVGCAKILQFCNIFIKDAADISRYQKNEIVKYVRTRIPIFTSEIHQLLKNILSVFTSLNSEEKSELVNYLVPEIESTLLVLTNVIEEIKNSLEKMCKHLKCSHLDLSMKNEDAVAEAYNIKTSEFIASDENSVNLFSGVPLRRLPHAISLLHDASTDKQRLIAAGNDLKFVLYMYEVRKMRDIYGRISTALDIIRDKKSAFCEMNFLSKQSTIHQNLEQLILDIPSYILIVENLSERLDDKIGWKEFKFCFKLATSQINGVIVKLFDHKSALKDPITHVCKLVQKEEFTKSMIDLGLLEPTNILQSKKENEGYRDRNPLERQITYESVKLNLIKHLCEPPIAANSTLSKNALRLLHSAQLADMEFEVQVLLNNQLYPCEAVAVMQSQRQNNASDNYGDCISEERGVEQKKRQRSHIEQLQVHTFRAHRVIVSARCEWFKKALLSGMQESINRKIIITDTSPVIFRRLLLYLYGAPIDKTVGAEQICELMLLADRYSIEDLKELCENTLNSLIDEDSVVCLLGIADRYIAGVLKSKCLSFLSQHSNLTKLEMFKQLPQSIQHEVKELIHWYDRVSEPWNDGFKSRSNSRHSLKSPSKPRSRSRKSSPSYI